MATFSPNRLIPPHPPSVEGARPESPPLSLRGNGASLDDQELTENVLACAADRGRNEAANQDEADVPSDPASVPATGVMGFSAARLRRRQGFSTRYQDKAAQAKDRPRP